MDMTTYGLDIAKCVFQLYWVDTASGEISNRAPRGQLGRWASRSGQRR